MWHHGRSIATELKLAVYDLCQFRLTEFNQSRPCLILMYHGVVSEHPSRFNWRHVSTADFEVHLQMLRRHCNVLSLADLHGENLCPKRLNVALTFDDGFRNNFLHALPLLEKYKTPASFYVTGANEIGIPFLWPDFLDILSRHADGPIQIEDLQFVKRGRTFVEKKSGDSLANIIKHQRPAWDFKQAMFDAFRRWQPNLSRPDYRPYWELMSDEEIRQASSSGWVTIGCHGYYHNNLGELPLQDALEELEKSRSYLEHITGSPVRELAFPDGSYSQELMAKMQDLRFDIVLGTNHRFEESRDCASPYARAGIYSFRKCRTQLVAAVEEVLP